MLTRINTERSDAGLNALTLNPLLNDSAQLYAEQMSRNDFFSHTDPSGRYPIDRIRNTGYLRISCDCSWQYRIGENLAQGQATVSAVMDDWMDSSTHRDNILDSRFTEIGIGYDGSTWVQHFGHVTLRETAP